MLIYAITWMNLEYIMLNERSQTQKAAYYMIAFIYEISRLDRNRYRRQVQGFQGIRGGRHREVTV